MAARIATTVAGALGLSWLLIFLTPSPALAHASYVRSDPPDLCGPLAAPRLPAGDTRCETGLVLQTPPNAVTITFSEPVSLLGYGIRVLAPSGKRADKRPAQAAGSQATVPVDSSELGTYVVLWQVESSDTHPARGQFAFSVGQPSKPAISSQGINVGAVAPAGLALQTVARWLHFTGYALAFGVLGIILLTSAPLTPRTSRLVNAGIGALLLAEPLALFGETGSLGLDQMLDGDVMGDALASSFGRLMGFRIAAALLLWVTTGALRSTPAPANANSKFQIPPGSPLPWSSPPSRWALPWPWWMPWASTLPHFSRTGLG